MALIPPQVFQFKIMHIRLIRRFIFIYLFFFISVVINGVME